MSAHRSLQCTLASIAALCAAVVCPGCFGGGGNQVPDAGAGGGERGADVTSPEPWRPFVRGCRDRVEGGRFTPKRGRDTVVGPVAFPYLADSYREAARRDPRRSPPPGDFNAHPFKALALVRSGTRVTLAVPRAQRSWMQLLYHPSAVWRGSLRMTLQACRRRASPAGQRAECGWRPHTACRWRNTQFSGAIYIDFERAPQQGRCAQLALRVTGRDKPLRRRLFRPAQGSCKAQGGVE